MIEINMMLIKFFFTILLKLIIIYDIMNKNTKLLKINELLVFYSIEIRTVNDFKNTGMQIRLFFYLIRIVYF
jgi:hypothetical protein